jgi:hypothetical protein
MKNLLVQLIDEGRLSTPEQLKSAYRRMSVRAHPDIAGSNEYLDLFLSLSNHYEEAKAYLAARLPAAVADANHRLAFFRQLRVIETIEAPYAFHATEYAGELRAAKREALAAMEGWRPDLCELYQEASTELAQLKAEKPRGPYMKHALALNVRPLMHDLIGYHLTGKSLYARMARQNRTGILHQLEVNGRKSLGRFLAFLVEDMGNGPAILA